MTNESDITPRDDFLLRNTRIADASGPWVSAIREYDSAAETADQRPNDLTTMTLVNTMRTLVDAMHEMCYGPQMLRDDNLEPLRKKIYQIMQDVQEETIRHLSNHFTDSDTDAPCDVEWDLMNFVREVNPDQGLWDDGIEPAYVRNTVYDTPDV